MPYFDHWFDYYRLAILIVCVICTVMLTNRFIRHRKAWNSKTIDYWYSMMMWSIAGSVIAVEGIRLDSPFSVRTVFVSLAAVVSLRGLMRKGSWGHDD